LSFSSLRMAGLVPPAVGLKMHSRMLETVISNLRSEMVFWFSLTVKYVLSLS